MHNSKDVVIEVPDEIPGLVDDEEFEVGDIDEPAEPIQNWREVLSGFEYDSTAVEITRVDIDAVLGKELAGARWKTVHSAPDVPTVTEAPVIELTDEVIAEAIKANVLEMAEELTIQAGYAAGFKSEVYSALMQHIREKFMGGASLGLADRKALYFAWKMLQQVRQKVAAEGGLIAGIIEYGTD